MMLIAKVNWGLESASDIMVTPKLDVASILCWNFIKQKCKYPERVKRNQWVEIDLLQVLAFLYNKGPTWNGCHAKFWSHQVIQCAFLSSNNFNLSTCTVYAFYEIITLLENYPDSYPPCHVVQKPLRNLKSNLSQEHELWYHLYILQKCTENKSEYIRK